MKLIKALTYIVILSLTCAGYAEAKGSFGGGFRSQRTAPAPRPSQPSAPAAAPSKSLFGSFGSKPTNSGSTTAPSGQPLNMSKDLNANAAQRNAQNTADSRNNAQAAGTSNNTGTGWFRSGNNGAQSAAPTGAMQPAQPIVVHQGGGFMNNAMWFMLGNSLASHHQSYVQPVNQNGEPVVNPGDVNDIQQPVAEKESFFMKLLRLVLWIAILAGIYWLVKTLLRSRKHRAEKKPNYTFGNN